jgi:hypothetical protein
LAVIRHREVDFQTVSGTIFYQSWMVGAGRSWETIIFDLLRNRQARGGKK